MLGEELRREIEGEKREVSGMAESQAAEFTSQHQADVGSDLYLEERALSAQRALEEELTLVNEALERLAAGTYGRCVDCAGAISSERLEARPHAIRCIACERKFEAARGRV